MAGRLLATALVTVGWGSLVWSGSFKPSGQCLALPTSSLRFQAGPCNDRLVNSGRGRYAWVTVPPMLFDGNDADGRLDHDLAEPVEHVELGTDAVRDRVGLLVVVMA